MPTQQQQRVALVLAGTLLAVIVALVLLVFIQDRREYFWMLRGLLRFTIAVTGGIVASYFVGKLAIGGKAFGLAIRATGGFAVFIILLIWDPFAGVLPGPPIFEGDRLGDFVEFLQQAYAEGKTPERIQLAPKNSERLAEFRLSVPSVSAKTWIKVSQKICELHPCLVCRVYESEKRVEFDFASEPKECWTSSKHVYYRCAPTNCGTD